MWNFGVIVGGPDKFHPWEIKFLVEFMQVFDQQSITLCLQVNDSKATTVLRAANHLPSSKGVTCVPLIRLFGTKAFLVDFIYKFQYL
jgi:hypothetical protein